MPWWQRTALSKRREQGPICGRKTDCEGKMCGLQHLLLKMEFSYNLKLEEKCDFEGLIKEKEHPRGASACPKRTKEKS